LLLSEIKINHRWNTDGLTDGETQQKKFSREKITDRIHPSAFSTVITDGPSVGDGGMAVNISELCQIPTNILCR
jgi:hypothetical protein